MLHKYAEGSYMATQAKVCAMQLVCTQLHLYICCRVYYNAYARLEVCSKFLSGICTAADIVDHQCFQKHNDQQCVMATHFQMLILEKALRVKYAL
jgi:hypothetical protein